MIAILLKILEKVPYFPQCPVSCLDTLLSLQALTSLHKGYEESPRSSTHTNGVETSTALPSISVDKGKERAVHASTAIDKGEAKATSSLSKIDKGKQKAVDVSITCNKREAKTPDSYLNLLIAACDDPKTPDSCLRELLNTSIVANSPTASTCLYRDSDHQSLSWWDTTLVEDDENHENHEEFSAPPPPYTSNEISDSELGEVTFNETAPCEHSDHSGTSYRFPVATIREIDSSEESPDPLANIDTVFHLRGGDRRSRYEKLMTYSQSMGRSSDESVENRVKRTVAKMTKNYHVGSSEEWSEDTSATRYSDQIEFETNEMEVWDSIIVGSRTLQEVCDILHRFLRKLTMKRPSHSEN